MKNLIKLTAIALTLTATTASANTQVWEGRAGEIGADGCTFTNRGGANVGQMARSEVAGEEHIWKTTRRAGITVHARGQSSVTLTSDNVLYNANGNAVADIVATFNYNGQTGDQGSVIQKRGASNSATNDTSLVVSNLQAVEGSSQINFFAGGTVTMTSNGQLNGQNPLNGLTNNAMYRVIHTVTCVQ